jgi:hypothetical protein
VLFREAERQTSFDENGYVVLDLLSAAEIETVLELYRETVGDRAHTNLLESSRICSLETNLRIMNGLRGILGEPLSRLFASSSVFGGTFYNKVPGTSELLPLHQDWSVVEEDVYESAYIWCALVDVSPERGGIFVLPGSHRYFDNFRSGSMPSPRIPPRGPLAELIVDVPLRAGQAIAWSDRLFHGSRPNCTDKPRFVCTGRVNQEGASLVYYHRTDEDRVVVLKVDPEWWLRDAETLVRGGSFAGYDLLKTISYRYIGVTEERLLARLAELEKLPQTARAHEAGGIS